MKCSKCGCVIPRARLKALPGTTTCVLHSDVQKVEGCMIVSHKTGSEFIKVPDDPE